MKPERSPWELEHYMASLKPTQPAITPEALERVQRALNEIQAQNLLWYERLWRWLRNHIVRLTAPH